MPIVLPYDTESVHYAAGELRSGGVVAFATETVYGLGARTMDPEAIAKLYALKRRPSDNPLIAHVLDVASARPLVADWPREAAKLATRFWPGPLTMIFRRSAGVPDAVTGGQDTVAIRVPVHPVAQALLRAFAGGIAAPSANRFGHVSATTAAHVRTEFGAAVPCVLDGGDCDVGIESTILDVRGTHPVLLRPGGISRAALSEALNEEILLPGEAAPRAPGTLKAHYAPGTPLMLVEPDVALELVHSLARQGKQLAVLSFSPLQPLVSGLTWRVAATTPEDYAHALYSNLRDLDATNADMIIVERPPERAEWSAILDRLTRAAAGSSGDDDEP